MSAPLLINAVRGKVILTLFGLALTHLVFAQLKLPALFNDNMVLQQGVKIPVWGWAPPGSYVKVSFAGQIKTTRTDHSGSWTLSLDPQPASEKGSFLVIESEEEIVKLKNVLVGEVWICSGQSNMRRTVKDFLATDQNNTDEVLSVVRELKDMAREPDSLLRSFIVALSADLSEGRKDPKRGKGVYQSWHASTYKVNLSASATAFVFAKELRRTLKVPVGIICAAVGGTRIEPWMPEAAFAANKILKQTLKNNRDEITAAIIKAPGKAGKLKSSHHNFTSLYNGMISPLVPFAVKGFIWYQGESNTGSKRNGDIYDLLMKRLIESWRTSWKQRDLPFYIVQLSSFRKHPNVPVNEEPWAKLREKQLEIMNNIPHTGMAVTIDIGEKNNIHPVNKIDVGKRLSFWALNRDYGRKDIYCSGPVFKKLKIKGRKAIIEFNYAGSGLMAASKYGTGAPTAEKGSRLYEFEIAGKDRVWRKAVAYIAAGNQVWVESDEVDKPVAVRYAWSSFPERPNLYGRNGLPASPFRSDNRD